MLNHTKIVPDGQAELVPDLEAAAAFLAKLDPKATSWTFQTFDDVKPPKGQPSRERLVAKRHGTLAQHADFLAEMNSRGAGVFVTINETDGRGRKAENITRVRALWVDLDGPPLWPVQEWEEPHIITQSSAGRWHAYYLVDGMPLDGFTPRMERLIQAFGSDGVKDLPRVMRLPGFHHMKDEPLMVREIVTNAFPAPFSLAELDAKMAKLPRTARVIKFPGERWFDTGPELDLETYTEEEFINDYSPETATVIHTAAEPLMVVVDTGQAFSLATDEKTTPAEVEEALSYINPDIEYSHWLDVLMSLHAWDPVNGLEIADKWSSGGTKYKPGEIARKFSGFKPSGGITISTLFKMAADAGCNLSELTRKHRSAAVTLPPANQTQVDGPVVVTAGQSVQSRVDTLREGLKPLDLIGFDLTSRYLVKGWLDQGASSVVYGESNVGKTFFMMDMAMHVAAGMEWQGNRVPDSGKLSGPVVYIASEGGKGINARIEAMRRHKPELAERAGGRFYLLQTSLDLCTSNDAAHLVEAMPANPCLVVIDTLARNMGNGDENTARDMGAIVRSMDMIRAATGAHVVAVHHSGKDGSKGARGSSSLRGATDTEIELTRSGEVIMVSGTKQRDKARGGPGSRIA